MDENCPKCSAPLGADDLACPKCGALVRTQRRLGEILLKMGYIQQKQLDVALQEQDRKLGEILVQQGLLQQGQLETALAQQDRKLGNVLMDSGVLRRTQLNRALEVQASTREPVFENRSFLRIGLMSALIVAAGLVAWVFYTLERDKSFLARLKNEALSIDEVSAILSESDNVYQFDALRSLNRNLEDRRALELISRSLKSEKWYVRLFAADLAESSGNKTFAGALIPMLGEPRLISQTALSALKKITGQDFGVNGKAWEEWARRNNVGF